MIYTKTDKISNQKSKNQKLCPKWDKEQDRVSSLAHNNVSNQFSLVSILNSIDMVQNKVQ